MSKTKTAALIGQEHWARRQGLSKIQIEESDGEMMLVRSNCLIRKEISTLKNFCSLKKKTLPLSGSLLSH